MFNTHSEANINYLAKVITLDNLIRHPKADRLQLTKVDGNTVILDLSAKLGDVFVYFPVESAINPSLLSFTNSFSDETKNLDTDPNKKGFFGNQCRVRALKLRDIPSQGYMMPFDKFMGWVESQGKKVTTNLPKDAFSHYDDLWVLEKYIPLSNGSNEPKGLPAKIVPNQFAFHESTPQLGANVTKISPESIIAVTVKLHGTSGVFAKALLTKQLSFWQKCLKFLGAKVEETEYKPTYSSRNVVKNIHIDNAFGNDVYGKTAKELNKYLHKGMALYGEIVGHKPGGGLLQKGYDYSVPEGQSDFYVYRITTTTPDGHTTEWSMLQVQQWAEQNGVKAVPMLYYGQAKNLFPDLEVGENWHDNFLTRMSETFLETDEPLCQNKVPREGVCVRVEDLTLKTFKHKSFRFYELETKALDAGELDMETAN